MRLLWFVPVVTLAAVAAIVARAAREVASVAAHITGGERERSGIAATAATLADRTEVLRTHPARPGAGDDGR
ncbi:MAG TPA: hypothetical protein VK866_16940 [Acidimicrobiales bacterium]|nr:hypothetical protein [Acidimicrobiales bacterium]